MRTPEAERRSRHARAPTTARRLGSACIVGLSFAIGVPVAAAQTEGLLESLTGGTGDAALRSPAPAASPPDGGPAGPIETDAGADDDAAIAERIRAILQELEGYDRTTVTVRAGVVRLAGEVSDPPLVARAVTIARRTRGVVEVRNAIRVSERVGERVTPVIDRLRARWQQATVLLPILALGAIAFTLLALVGWWLSRRAWPWSLLTPNPFVRQVLRQVFLILFLGSAALVALDVVGASGLLSTLLGTAGLIGLAFGFAVRDTVENYVASILLSLRQPFGAGDLVKIGNQEGHVIRLNSRATILLSPQGNHVRIPNAAVYKAVVINFTRDPRRRLDFGFDLAAGADLGGVQRVALQALREAGASGSLLAQPAPMVTIEHVDETRVRMVCYGRMDQNTHDFATVRSATLQRVFAALVAADYRLASRSRRVLMRSSGAAPDETDTDASSAQSQVLDALPDSQRDARRRALEEAQRTDAENLIDGGGARLE